MTRGTGAGRPDDESCAERAAEEPSGVRAADEPSGVRAALDAERRAIVDQVAGLERDFGGIVAASQADNAEDEHHPEGATIAWERQHVAALLDQAREHLAAVAEALRRLGEGDYGRCEVCGQPIAPERLGARAPAPRRVARGRGGPAGPRARWPA